MKTQKVDRVAAKLLLESVGDTDPVTEDTSVPGVYVAGDGSRDVLMVSIAIAEGAKAAVAIIKAILRRDGFCE